MNASIEWLCGCHCGVIRVHPASDGKLGDEYTYAVVFKRVAPSMVEMVGAMKAANKYEWATMETCLLSVGINAVRRTRRYPDGRMRKKTTILKKHRQRYERMED